MPRRLARSMRYAVMPRQVRCKSSRMWRTTPVLDPCEVRMRHLVPRCHVRSGHMWRGTRGEVPCGRCKMRPCRHVWCRCSEMWRGRRHMRCCEMRGGRGEMRRGCSEVRRRCSEVRSGRSDVRGCHRRSTAWPASLRQSLAAKAGCDREREQNDDGPTAGHGKHSALRPVNNARRSCLVPAMALQPWWLLKPNCRDAMHDPTLKLAANENPSPQAPLSR